MSLQFDIKYEADVNGTKSNESVNIVLRDVDGYDGECTDTYESLSIDFMTGWNLELNYTLNKNAYFELSSILFKYTIDPKTFPNASQIGDKTVMLGNLTEFSAIKGNSYRCVATTSVDLNDDVKLEFSNYQAQPFLGKSTGFDTAVECAADTTGTSKLVPIIVGSALAVLVIMVLVAYIIGRRKHRPGYQQV